MGLDPSGSCQIRSLPASRATRPHRIRTASRRQHHRNARRCLPLPRLWHSIAFSPSRARAASPPIRLPHRPPPTHARTLAQAQVGRWSSSPRSAKTATFSLRRLALAVRAAAGNAPTSPVGEVVTEVDALASFSEIMPDTVVFDNFEKLASTAATVSSSLLLGIARFPNTKFKGAIDTTLADGECRIREARGPDVLLPYQASSQDDDQFIMGGPAAFRTGFDLQHVQDGLYGRHLHVYDWPVGELK